MPSEWRPEQVGPAFGGLLQHTKVLVHLSQNQLEHLPITRVGHLADAGHPSIDEGLLAADVGFHQRSAAVAGAVPRLALGRRLDRCSAERLDRVGQPPEMHVLAAQHLLVAVVGIVGLDRSRIRQPRVEQLERLPVELLKQCLQLGGGHEFCLALQVMHTRVQGMALRRASAMGSPQSRHTP